MRAKLVQRERELQRKTLSHVKDDMFVITRVLVYACRGRPLSLRSCCNMFFLCFFIIVFCLLYFLFSCMMSVQEILKGLSSRTGVPSFLMYSALSLRS